MLYEREIATLVSQITEVTSESTNAIDMDEQEFATRTITLTPWTRAGCPV